MRTPVLSDFFLGLGQAKESPYIAVAKIMKAGDVPYPGVPVDVSFASNPDRVLATLISDDQGFVVYPSNIATVFMFAPTSPKSGYSFVPSNDPKNQSIASIKRSNFSPNDEEGFLRFYEVKGVPTSWKTYLIGAGVLFGVYYVWKNWDTLKK